MNGLAILMSENFGGCQEWNRTGAVDSSEIHNVRCCRLSARLRRKRHLQGTPNACWQVEASSKSIGRIYLLLTKEAAVAPNTDYLEGADWKRLLLLRPREDKRCQRLRRRRRLSRNKTGS